MDESHRLKTMVENYDQQLFLQLYKETSKLREKLAYEIDSRKFGVDYREMLSWFDVKFIHAFNKYYNDDRCKHDRENKLKAFIINSLQTYKWRVVKNSYLKQTEIHQTVDITELFNYEELLIDKGEQNGNLFNVAINYLKARLSDDAYLILNIDLNPPPYILARISTGVDQAKIPKCPAIIIAEYLGIDDNPNCTSYIQSLRKEVEQTISQAKEYFSIAEVSAKLSL